jgi:hypothetical protein
LIARLPGLPVHAVHVHTLVIVTVSPAVSDLRRAAALDPVEALAAD